MPARRGGVPYASGRSSTSVRFIDTRGQPTLGIVICQRCQTKRRLADVIEDGNIRNFYVCKPEISRGCWDQYDSFRLPAPPPDRLDLPFIRPDSNIAIEPDGLPPIGPMLPAISSGTLLLTEDGDQLLTEDDLPIALEDGVGT